MKGVIIMVLEYRTKDGIYDAIGIISFEIVRDMEGKLMFKYRDVFKTSESIPLENVSILRVERV